MTAAVQVAPMLESDLEDVRRFQLSQTSERTPELALVRESAASALWYLFENPEARKDIPKGFVARDDEGRVVGVKQCSPQRFQYGGDEFLLLCGGGFFVDSRHRGTGLRLMRAFLSVGGSVAHFASTMNEVSGAIYERYGGYSIPDTDHELIGTLRWSPLIEEAAHRRVNWSMVSRIVGAAGVFVPSRIARRKEGRLEKLDQPASLEELAVEPPPESRHRLTAVRSAAFLRWRYFDGPDPRRHALVYRHPSGVAGFVGVRVDRRGHRHQIRALTVLDYWGRLPESAIADVAALLAARFRDEVDMIVFRGQPPGRQAVLQGAGFLRRKLPRPIGICIDSAGRLPTKDWYMVPADGDMSI